VKGGKNLNFVKKKQKCYINAVSLATLQASSPGKNFKKKWKRGKGSYKVTKTQAVYVDDLYGKLLKLSLKNM
jgi:hypothetical protein